MADSTRDEVCISIDDKIRTLPSTFSEHTLFMIPLCLYDVNPKAYEPRIISIGPYHHGKPHLKMMEVHKVQYLGMLLRRTSETSAERYVALMQGMVKQVRNCYAESLSMSDEKFIEMLVLDGCFIVELLHHVFQQNGNEYIFKHKSFESEILRDLILLKNQLPFFLLLELFDMMKGLYATEEYVDKLLFIYESSFHGLRVENASIEDVNHLLDLVVKKWLPSRELMEDYSQAPGVSEWVFIHSATKLREAGISFRKGKGDRLFDIKFENGVLEIPTIMIEDDTESLYRNAIVCEQFGNKKPTHFIDFHRVMDNLINTGKDVELLCQYGIIDNGLGDDEAVATMINGLGEYVIFNRNTFFYAKLFNDVNKHFNRPWNKRMASLRHNYFNTPWALVSFLATVLLLLFTVLQTAFTILPR